MTATTLAATGVSILVAAPSAQAQVITNIAYAPAQPAGSQGHLLDLYLPGGGAGPRPLVIWTGGSAWMSDTGKSTANSIATVFNPLGYAVAGVSVRSSSQAKFPAQVFDIKAAIRWLRANAGQFQLDPTRFAVMGDSSGGWEADMAAFTGGVAALEGTVGTAGVSSAVQAGVAFFGPTDFLRMNSERLPGGLDHDAANSPESLLMGCAIQTCRSQVEQADPITYIDRNDPPVMLLHGQADPLVPHGQSVDLYNAVKSVCGTARFFSVPGAGHSRSDVMSTSRFGSQTVRTTTGCQETVTTGSPNPSWDTIASFLNTALHVGGGTPTPTPTPTPTGTPTGSQPAPGACRVSDTVNAWDTGLTSSMTITNTGSSTINGWSLVFTLPGGQAITSGWNATYSPAAGQVTARNVSYNATLAPGASTDLGFQASHTGNAAAPPVFTLNGMPCTLM